MCTSKLPYDNAFIVKNTPRVVNIPAKIAPNIH